MVIVLIHNRKEILKLKGIEDIFKQTAISYKIQTLSSKIRSRQLRSLMMKGLVQGAELFIVDEINKKYLEYGGIYFGHKTH
ncbi:MAG: hypothetical protein QME58_08265 [Bacteroidota bacterium]|nr:hypothetical protein [Bacteroidota bacterium]